MAYRGAPPHHLLDYAMPRLYATCLVCKVPPQNLQLCDQKLKSSLAWSADIINAKENPSRVRLSQVALLDAVGRVL